MNGRTFLQLSPNWRLASDGLQWIVQRRYPLRNGIEKWNSVSFVGSTKLILIRVLREKYAQIDSGGERVMDALPETFKAWREADSALLSGQVIQFPLGDTRKHSEVKFSGGETGTDG